MFSGKGRIRGGAASQLATSRTLSSHMQVNPTLGHTPASLVACCGKELCFCGAGLGTRSVFSTYMAPDKDRGHVTV